ncbi:MAG: sulfurtransferase TusA family protein [Planctomycetes bacterium]|nr:sulfurtransferase TusA family protein [Planctomycetota bacterium]
MDRTDAPALPEHARFDAGSMGCGELLIELRLRLRALEPGSVLALHALDPGAVQDLPAWCRLVGHTMLRQEPPYYWIQKSAPSDQK